MSEAFASDSVLKLGWDSRRLRFPGFVLAFSTAFLEGRARRAPTGVLPYARLGVSRHRRARRSRTRRIFAGARRHGGSISFGTGDLFRCCCSAKSFFFVTDSILAFFSARFDLSALLMLPLSIDSYALRAAIGLFEPLGRASLGGCLPLPLPLRRSTTRAFSGYRAVLVTRWLDISVIWCFIIRHVILFAGGLG